MVTVHTIGAFLPQLKGLVRDIRVVWTLEELGLPYERKVMDATKGEHKQPEYLALNPFGRVPAIQDGDFTLFESSAICSYLGDKAGKLLPAPATRERTIYDQWISYITSTFEFAATRIAWLDFFNEKNEVTLQLRADCLESVKTQATALDGVLADRPYLLGECFSIADIQLAAVCRIIGHTEVPAQLPSLNRYLQRCYARPAFARALENNG